MTELGAYKLLFMTELLLSSYLFVHKLKKRDYFAPRVLVSVLFCYLVAFFYPVKGEYASHGYYASLMFFALAAAVLFSVVFSFDISFPAGVFFLITAYTVQHIAYVVYSLVVLSLGITDSGLYGSNTIDFSSLTLLNLLCALIYIDITLLAYWGTYLAIGKRLVKNGEIKMNRMPLLVLSAVILVIDIVVNAVVVYDFERVKGYEVVVYLLNLVCCALILYIQVSIVDTKDKEEDLKTVRKLLEQAKTQYASTKENISLINQKCHDLKYKVGLYAQKGGIDKESADEIRDLIAIYDTSVKTGNEALDIVLTEKSFVCGNKKIRFSCIADCRNLSFVKESDLYALFGNVLDNAIEAVKDIQDEEKRFISLSVYTRGNIVSINENNYFEGSLLLDDDGLPLTTKRDKDYHGFGIKSVKTIAEKYGGMLSLSAEENVFNLNIILPLPAVDADFN